MKMMSYIKFPIQMITGLVMAMFSACEIDRISMFIIESELTYKFSTFEKIYSLVLLAMLIIGALQVYWNAGVTYRIFIKHPMDKWLMNPVKD